MKLKLLNIQFSKISIFSFKEKSFTDEELLRIVSIIHWNFTSIYTKCSIHLYHKRSWIPAFFNLIFDRNFHYYLIIIQSRKWISQKGEEFCN
jgi:hypothetical protein